MRALLRLLEGVVPTAVEDGPLGPMIRVDYRHGTAQLLPVWAGAGFPQDVRELVNAGVGAGHGTPVLVAGRMSPGARDLIEAEGLSWADEHGRAHVQAPPGLLLHLDRDHPRSRPAGGWSEATAAVAETVLEERFSAEAQHQDVLPRPSRIMRASGWSSSQVSRAMRFFDDEGWTAKVGPERGPGSRRAWRDPAAALSAWAAWHRARPVTAVSVHGVENTDEALARLRELSADAWMLSGWSAAELVAPVTTTVNVVTVYLDPDFYDRELREFLRRSELREVERGGRLTFWRADRHLFSHAGQAQGWPLVGPIRLYGDLLRLGVRGEQAADHLRETFLGI